MLKTESEFKQRVCELVSQIPFGRVVTYGDLAISSGHPNAARIVGQIAHFGPPDLPWHRVVNRMGGLASGYYGGRECHKRMLETEGIRVDVNFIIINFEEYRWRLTA